MGAQLTTQQEVDFSWWQRADDADSASDFAQALVCIEYYRTMEPEKKHTHQLYGEILTKLRRFDEAATSLARVSEPLKDYPRLRSYGGWKTFSLAQNQYSQAEQWCRKLTELRPDETWPVIYLGMCLVHQEKFEEAKNAYRKATKLKGNPDEAFLNLGFVLRAEGRFIEARQAFLAALELCPDYPAAERALEDVKAAIELQHEARCEQMSDAAHVKIPRDEMWGMYMDNYAQWRLPEVAGLRRVRAAINEREEKLFSESDYTFSMWWDRALDFGNKGAMAQALVAIEHCRTIHSGCLTLALHGMILTDLCRLEEARMTLHRADALLKTKPKKTGADLIMKAWAHFYCGLGEFEQEEEWLRKAVGAEPESVWYHIHLGSCLSRQGRLLEAEKCFRQAAEIDDEKAVALLRLGLALRSQGRFQESARELKRALRIDPDCKASRAALKDVQDAIEIERGLKVAKAA